MPKKIIVRRGLNGFRYAAYTEKGAFIANFEKLVDVRRHWRKEIELERVEIVRQLKEKSSDAGTS